MGAETVTHFHQVERRQAVLNMEEVSAKLDTLLIGHRRMDTALFARDADNEFGCAGVMTVMQKIDQHIDTLCKVASGVRKVVKFGFWAVTGAAGTVAAMKAAGWW